MLWEASGSSPAAHTLCTPFHAEFQFITSRREHAPFGTSHGTALDVCRRSIRARHGRQAPLGRRRGSRIDVPAAGPRGFPTIRARLLALREATPAHPSASGRDSTPRFPARSGRDIFTLRADIPRDVRCHDLDRSRHRSSDRPFRRGLQPGWAPGPGGHPFHQRSHRRRKRFAAAGAGPCLR